MDINYPIPCYAHICWQVVSYEFNGKGEQLMEVKFWDGPWTHFETMNIRYLPDVYAREKRCKDIAKYIYEERYPK